MAIPSISPSRACRIASVQASPGDGCQIRSFLYIDECIEGVRRLMDSDFSGPVNIGSEEMVTINQLAELIMRIAAKRLTVRHIPGPLGVRGRNSDNRLIERRLGWKPTQSLRVGLEKTYTWIAAQVLESLQSLSHVLESDRALPLPAHR